MGKKYSLNDGLIKLLYFCWIGHWVFFEPEGKKPWCNWVNETSKRENGSCMCQCPWSVGKWNSRHTSEGNAYETPPLWWSCSGNHSFQTPSSFSFLFGKKVLSLKKFTFSKWNIFQMLRFDTYQVFKQKRLCYYFFNGKNKSW